MLHCYDWPFKGIEANLDQIAAAGFNSIQVSPIQKIRKPSPKEQEDNPPTGPWWLLYQPVSFETVGNDKLGTEAEFKKLCEKAEEKGIKIIVDVILNHVAATGKHVSQDDELDIELRNPALYHNKGKINDYGNRWQVTQCNMGSQEPTLPDLNTQDQRVQDIHVRFLNKCIGLGADGFRFDAAKHIECSCGEDREWAGDYWDDILHRLNNLSNLYLVGEVIQHAGADNISAYVSHYDVTCHKYGWVLRDAFQSKDANKLKSFIDNCSGVRPDRCLAYVENHDNYEHNESRSMPYWDRKAANAFLIARAGIVPRVLDRREDDIWNDLDIVAVNHFHNALVGTGEYLRFPSDKVVIVERGNHAVVVINLGQETNLNTDTGLADGSYVNRAAIPGTLSVHNRKLKGRLPQDAIFVSYSDGENVKTVFRAKYDVGLGHDLYIRGNTPPLSWSKGIKMQWTEDNNWIWNTFFYPAGTEVEFKVLIDDQKWEIIDGQSLRNHKTSGGNTTELIAPKFPG